MALDFSFSDISKYFGELKKDTNDFFDSTSKKLTNSLENQKNEFIDFTKELKSNAKELIDTTVDKVDKKFESLSDTASQKAKEISTLVEKFIDEIPEKTNAVISKAETKINEFKTDAKEWIETNLTWENTKAVIVTSLASFVEGFIDIGEGVVDSHIYTVSIIVELLSKAGVNVDNTKLNDIIAYDVSSKMYDAIIEKTGVNKDIAYSGLRGVGNFAGEMVGYYALSSVPFVGKALSALGGVGNSVEESINDQMKQTGAVNELKVFGRSIFGALEGLSFGKMTQGASKGIKALKGVGKTAGKGGFKSILSKVMGGLKNIGKGSNNGFIKKNFGKIFKNTLISTASDEDTYLDTASVLANNICSYQETGKMDWKRLFTEALGSIGLNILTNIGSGYTDTVSDMAKKTDLGIKKSSIDVETKTNVVKPNTIDEQIALANHNAGKGIFTQVKIDNIDDLNLKQLDNISDAHNTTMYNVIKSGDKLPANVTLEGLNRGKNAITAFEITSGSAQSAEVKKLLSDVLESDYKYDLGTPEGIKSVESIQKYYDGRLFQQVENNIYDSIKKSILDDSKLDITSYRIRSDGTMSINYSVNGNSSLRAISKFEADEIFNKSYQTAGSDTLNMVLHFEENIPNVGKNRAYKYEALINYNSVEDVVKHMTDSDIAEYEAVWKKKTSIDGTDKEYNFGFFTTENNISKWSKDGHIIGYDNADGTSTQWGLSLSSLKENLSAMNFNGTQITKDTIKNMTDVEVQNLAEDLIAVPRGSYDGQNLVFIAGNRNINITNMTSNSLKGANDLYAAYGRTAGNLFEADVGAVDIHDSGITKKSINGIREMFETLLS